MPTSWNFDTLFPDYLTGTMYTPQVIDLDGTKNRVLEIHREYQVVLDWEITGTGADSLGGKWVASISLESLGPSHFEGEVWSKEIDYVNVAPGSTMTNRKWHLEAHIINPITPDLTDGVYKVTTLILYRDPMGKPDPMAAFSEGPTVAFFTPA